MKKMFFALLLVLSSVLGLSAADKQLELAVEDKVAQAKIPGMVAAITSSSGVLAIGSAGVRNNGSEEKFAEDDLVHLGSCTKAMTSVLMATLVDEGKLTWETSLISVLPELKGKIHPDHHAVTVWQLLTHRAGMESDPVNWWIHRKMDLKMRRLAILNASLRMAPTRKQGEYHYSNLGYLIAGCMAEKITGTTWESLMQRRIFEPLGMDSAGFGPPGSPGKTDQPWGHVRSKEGWRPRQFDNAQALGPAGRVHCKVSDWAKFLAIQLPDGNKLGLKDKILNKLITPTRTYAGGWTVTKREWGKGTVLMHSGSNTMWYALVWVAPKIDRAFIVVTNSRDQDSHHICDQMIGALIGLDRRSNLNK
ncbi:MAG: beta-lactamase family protein [Opitutae bacterium]|nr:beta-lactamase family protein [Opitutae bacterium]MBT5692103.1 beta-lactamase family protein [Opitutae bacterium]MBT6956976.1 beta-lactamase family protein [Opitutae bacterium]MBT7852966.1 beta-lactamase family protein [Opitutae bacterium]